MEEKKYTDAELIAAHKLVWPGPISQVRQRTGISASQSLHEFIKGKPSVEDLDAESRLADARSVVAECGWGVGLAFDIGVFLLALGKLPEGWSWNPIMSQYEGPGDGFIPTLNPLLGPKFKDWPEAVRAGRAAEAGMLLAAHVELERRREAKQGGEE